MIVGTTPLLVALPLAPKVLWMMLKPERTCGNDRMTMSRTREQHVAPGTSARDLCQGQSNCKTARGARQEGVS